MGDRIRFDLFHRFTPIVVHLIGPALYGQTKNAVGVKLLGPGTAEKKVALVSGGNIFEPGHAFGFHGEAFSKILAHLGHKSRTYSLIQNTRSEVKTIPNQGRQGQIGVRPISHTRVETGPLVACIPELITF